MNLSVILFLAATNFFHLFSKDDIERTWYNAKKTAKIQVYKASDGKYYGKIVWLSEPNDNGKPKTDKENPDASKKNTPILNLVILKNFTQNASSPNIYEDGTVYDPDSGKTYCGKLTLNGNQLKLKGFICSFSWLSRSETWTAAE